MTENTGEEHLNNPKNNQSENHPVEVNHANDSATIAANKETENMEVHHHAHDPLAHNKKNWKSYFREFLMLFLAVFCGFLAENYREHRVEIEREKQYIHLLMEDIQTDITQINQSQSQLIPFLSRLDSIIENLNESNDGIPSVNCYRQISTGFGFRDFIYNDGTMQQLKNAGGMRLIRNLTVANSILKYDQSVRRTLALQDIINNVQLPRMVDKVNNFINTAKMKKFVSNSYADLDTISMKKTILLSHDQNDLTRFANQVEHYRYSIYYLIDYLTNTREQGIQLLSQLKKDYATE